MLRFKYILCVLLILIFAGQAGATQRVIGSADLPYYLVSGDTVTFSSSRIVSNTNGIAVAKNASNVLIDFDGDTLDFGAGNGNSNFGILIGEKYPKNNVMSNIIVKNGLVRHVGDSLSNANRCIAINGCEGVYIENMSAYIYGSNGKAIRAPCWSTLADVTFTNTTPKSFYATNNNHIVINGGTYTSNVWGYTNRCTYDAAVIHLSSVDTTYLSMSDTGSYAFKVCSTTVVNAPGQGIVFYGKVFVFDNDVEVDCRNFMYTFPTDNFCKSQANSFALLSRLMVGGDPQANHWGAGSKIYNNYLHAGEDFYGMDGGIEFEGNQGHPDYPVEICNNTIVSHRGWDVYYGFNVSAKGMKNRRGDEFGDLFPNKHVYVHDNDITVLVVNDTINYKAYGRNGGGFFILPHFDRPDSNVIFEHNTITAIVIDTIKHTTTTWDSTHCVGFVLLNDENIDQYHIRYNVIRHNFAAYGFGDYDPGGRNYDIYEDTIISFDTLNGYHNRVSYVSWPGDLSGSFGGHVFTDCYFDPDTAWDRFRWRSSLYGQTDIKVKKNLNVLVLKADMNSQPGASVYVKNAYGQVIINTTTDGDGWATGLMTAYYESRTETDSAAFFPCSLIASLYGDTTIDTMSFINNLRFDTLVLQNTGGPPDTDISIMYMHMSIGGALLLAPYPYSRGLKSVLDSVGKAHDTTIWMWDYRCNTIPSAAYAGWRTARFDSLNGTNAGWMLPQPYNDYYHWSAHAMPPESLLSYWQGSMSKDSIKGGTLLLDTVFDANADPDSIVDITSFDMVMFAGNPFVLTDRGSSPNCIGGLTDQLLADYKAMYLTMRDSAANYPEKKFVYFTMVPVMYGSFYQTCMDADEFDRMLDFIAWMTDTLPDPDNYPNFYVWDFFNATVNPDPQNDSFGYRLSKYDNDALHPNAMWYLEFKDSVASWLTQIYWPVAQESACEEPASAQFDDDGWTLLYSEIFDTTYFTTTNDTFGTDGWLTYRLFGNGEVSAADGNLFLTSTPFSAVALIRSTDTLPDEYKIRMRVGCINFDLENYDAGDTLDSDFDTHGGYFENGVYFLTITDDTCSGAECAEYWWHYHRKMVIDVDNHRAYGGGPDVVHPVFMVYMDPDTVPTPEAGNYLRTWDGVVWDSTDWNWNVAYTYDTTLWYYAEMQKRNDTMTLIFYNDAGTPLVSPDPVWVGNIFGMYGESDTLEYLYIGEPHSDDYKGNVKIDEISLWIPTSSSAKCARKIRSFYIGD